MWSFVFHLQCAVRCFTCRSCVSIDPNRVLRNVVFFCLCPSKSIRPRNYFSVPSAGTHVYHRDTVLVGLPCHRRTALMLVNFHRLTELNLELNSACMHKASDRAHWLEVVSMAALFGDWIMPMNKLMNGWKHLMKFQRGNSNRASGGARPPRPQVTVSARYM